MSDDEAAALILALMEAVDAVDLAAEVADSQRLQGAAYKASIYPSECQIDAAIRGLWRGLTGRELVGDPVARVHGFSVDTLLHPDEHFQ